MMIILAILVIFLFVVGSALIFQGFLETPEAATTVARQDFDQLKKELSNSAAAQGQLTSQLDKLTLEINQAHDDLQNARREAEAGEVFRRENAVLEERLRKTEENLHILRSEADRQARAAVEAITNLQEENRHWAEEVKLSENKVPAQELEKLTAEKKVLQDRIEEQVGRIKNLETEAARHQIESEQESQKMQAESQIWQRDRLCLMEGVRSLINRMGEVSAAVAQMKSAYHLRWEGSAQAVAALKEENAILLAQAQRGARVQELEGQLKDAVDKSRVDLHQAQERIHVLTAQLDDSRQRIESFPAALASEVEQQVAEVRRKSQGDQAADKEQILDLTEGVTQLRRDLESAQRTLQERERAFVLTRQQSEADQQVIARLNSEIDTLNARLAEMMEERLRLEAQIQNPPQDKGASEDLLAELENLRQQFASLQEYCVLIQEEMVKYRSKAEFLDISYQEVLGEYEKIVGSGRTS